MDGSLASTLLITIPAMLPVYKKLHIRPVTLLVIIGAAMSIMNLVPWGGPVARTGVVLNADVNALWQQLIPLQGVGLVIVVLFAAYMGWVEKRRGAGLHATGKAALLDSTVEDSDIGHSQAEFDAMKRPKLIWINLLITLGVIGLLCFTKVPLYGAFMLGLAIALIINFPGAKAQSKAIKMHADTALTLSLIHI